MPPHLSPLGSGPPPATRNERLLRGAVDRLRAELDECRAQRDENLANVRRIDDLRMAEIQRLRAELDAARQEPCEDCYERCCGAADVCSCHLRARDILKETDR